MKYVYLNDNTAGAIVAAEDPHFPGVPIEERYSPSFLAACVTTEQEVEIGHVYDPEAKTFSPPVIVPEDPPVVGPEQARELALRRLAGCCSKAIVAGCPVTCSPARGTKHYSFTEDAQRAISLMAQGAALGTTVFSYKADDEQYNAYTAAEVTVLFKALGYWITACTKYKEALEAWIAAETDTAVLQAINFGSKLPADRQAALVDYLVGVGVDTTTAAALLS